MDMENEMRAHKGKNQYRIKLKEKGIEIISKAFMGLGGQGGEFILYQDIISFNLIPGGLSGKLEIITPGKTRKFKGPIISKQFLNKVNHRISKAKNPEAHPNIPNDEKTEVQYMEGINSVQIDFSKIDVNAPPMEQDPIQILKKSKELLDLGAISEEEYNSIKEKHLKRI